MNVNVTTITSPVATVGQTTTQTIRPLVSGTIARIQVTNITTPSITGKTTITAPILTEYDASAQANRDLITENITNINIVEGNQIENENLFDTISGEWNPIQNTSLPTQSNLLDVSSRIFRNFNEILGISQEVYDLENAASGTYPLDAEGIDLSNRITANDIRIEDLRNWVIWLEYELNHDFTPVTGEEGDDLSGKITINTNELSRIRDIYNFLSNDLATIGNYNDISSRNIVNEETLIDVSNQFGNSINLLESTEQIFDTISSTTFIDTRQQENEILIEDISQRRVTVSNEIQDDIIDGNYTTIRGNGVDFGGSVYWNGKAVSFEGVTTISDTNHDFNRNVIDTSPNEITDISRDVSDIRFDFKSFTPYSPCTHILLDASESLVFDEIMIGVSSEFKQILSSGGFQAKIRLSRLSKSRKIIVSVPPTTTGQLSIELYDDDTFTTQSVGTEISNYDIRQSVTKNITEYFDIADYSTADVSYNLQQNMFVSPGTVPVLDVSYNNLNTIQTLFTREFIFGGNEVQYFHNPIRTFEDFKHSANIYGLVYDLPTSYFNNIANFPDLYQQQLNIQNLGTAVSTPSIRNLENLLQVSFPSMMASQTFNQSLRGNRVDFHFCGVPKLVYNTANLLNPITNTITSSTEHSSPFDYYAGNHYIFEIHLVSMGTPQHRHLAKVYITERTREQSENNYYKTKFINNLNIPPGFGSPIIDGSQIYTYLSQVKQNRTPPYRYSNSTRQFTQT